MMAIIIAVIMFGLWPGWRKDNCPWHKRFSIKDIMWKTIELDKIGSAMPAKRIAGSRFELLIYGL
jgi:hypothetical protein